MNKLLWAAVGAAAGCAATALFFAAGDGGAPTPAVAGAPGMSQRVETGSPGRAPTDVPAPATARPAPEPAPGPVAAKPRADEPTARPEHPARLPERQQGAAAAEAPCPEAIAARAEVAQLKDRVRALEEEANKGRGEDTRTFGLDQKELAELAARCELRWDMQPIRLDGAAGFRKKAIEAASLSEADQEAMAEVMTAYNDRMLTEVRRIYAEVTGDEENANMAPDAMIAEINDKSGQQEIQHIFQRLSAERAGITEPNLEGSSPTERLYRLFIGAGDSLETELAGRIGPDKARLLRESDHGWGSRSRSSPGCPR